MPSKTTQRDRPSDTTGTGGLWLERLTGCVLLLVLVALAWMVAVAAWPDFARLPSVQHEVLLMLILLGAALFLVSLVALLHTRR